MGGWVTSLHIHCQYFLPAETPWNLSIYKCWQPNPDAAAGWVELVDQLLLHHYSPEDPCTEQISAVMAGGQGTCSPFSHGLHWLCLQLEPAGTCNSLAITKKDLAQNHLRPVTEHTKWKELKKATWRCFKPLSSSSKAAVSFLCRNVQWPQLSLHACLPCLQSAAGALAALFNKWK